MGGICKVKIHIVQKGDTLWKLSKKYGVDFENLKSANQHLTNPDLIMPGMKINIPTAGITNPKNVPYQGEGAPMTKEQPIKKEMPQVQPIEEIPTKKEVKKKAPTPPPAVAPAPAPPPELKPTYQMQQAKMNVNIYKQPAAVPKVPMPPPAKKPKELPKKPKELPKKPISKPEPKVAPKEMVVPKPVKKLPEKKKPVAKPKMKPQPMPLPIQQPIYPISPVTEGCIPLSTLCGCQPYGMWPHQPMSMPAMHQPMYMMPYYPQQQAPLMPSQQMMYRGEEREDLVEDEYTTAEYGDLTEVHKQQFDTHKSTHYYNYNPHDPFYRMMPWTYPVSTPAQHVNDAAVEEDEDN